MRAFGIAASLVLNAFNREIVFFFSPSEIAAEKLAAAQGAPAQHLEGGMLAWEAAGLPVDKPAHLDN